MDDKNSMENSYCSLINLY